MAEFCEVMRQAARLCSQQTQCTGCPLVNLDGGLCELRRGYMGKFSEFVAREVDRVVMDWAAKNPELRFPTWVEWLKMLGVEKLSDIIPADIAEKLRIKPIGGEER